MKQNGGDHRFGIFRRALIAARYPSSWTGKRDYRSQNIVSSRISTDKRNDLHESSRVPDSSDWTIIWMEISYTSHRRASLIHWDICCNCVYMIHFVCSIYQFFSHAWRTFLCILITINAKSDLIFLMCIFFFFPPQPNRSAEDRRCCIQCQM